MTKVRLLFLFILFIGIVNWSQAQTVYVTRTGSKYHEGSCRYLRQSKIATSLAKAKTDGYTACSVCHPPTTVDETKEKGSAIQNNASPNNSTQQQQTIKSTQCTAITKAGARCKRTAAAGSTRCWQHLRPVGNFNNKQNIKLMRNTNIHRGAWTQDQIDSVWGKGQLIPGQDPNKIRKDTCGAIVEYSKHGKTTDKGWEIDHIKPKAVGGSDDLVNLQPLQWENNRHKGDQWPLGNYCLIKQ